MERNIGEVAKLFGVTVRTLRHWDALGLASPSFRDWNDYRLYIDADIERIQKVIAYRAVGFPLGEIKEIIDAPDTDSIAQLQRQRVVLQKQQHHLERMIQALDILLEETMKPKLTDKEKRTIFGDLWSPEYEAEAEERWGNTPEWQQSQAVQATMGAEDWIQVRDETKALEARLAAAMKNGVAPGTPEANALAEEHFSSIAKWFDITHAKHVLIARGYTEDPRFQQHYDSVHQGLAAWLRSIIEANAAEHGVDTQNAEWQ